MLIPVSGTLSNNEGVPLEGLCWIRLAIYATLDGGAPVYSETQEIMVEHGAFTAYMGSTVALDLSIFNGQDLYLGIKLGADDEMTPLLPFGSVPYAFYAQEAQNAQEAINAQEAVHAQEAALAQEALSSRETLAVPSGAVMHFDLAACPPGWSELTAARGRTIVALPSGGTLQGTQGLALPDTGTRTISQVPAHTHTNTPSAITVSVAAAGSHTHTVNPEEATTTNNGSHDHVLNYGTGGVYGSSYVMTTANSDSATRTPMENDGAHTHTIDIPSTPTTSAGSHSHTATATQPNFTSESTGSASVDVTMPYIQLLLCRKN